MKKLLFLWTLSGWGLGVHAQLISEKLWEKPVGSTLNGEIIAGWPLSQQTANGFLMFSFPYRLCTAKCSTTVVNRIISVDSTFKMEGRYILSANADYQPFINGYFVQNGDYIDNKTGIFYYLTNVYDRNSDLKASFRRTENHARAGMINMTPDGGLVMSLHGNGSNRPDSIIGLNKQGQQRWKYAMQSSLSWLDSTFKPAGSEVPFYWNHQIAYIARKEIRSKTDFSKLLSSQQRLVLVDSTGTEKWTVAIDSISGNTRIVGQNAQSQLVLLTLKESAGSMTKFDAEGRNQGSIALELPPSFNLNNVAFQSTPDNGFLLYRKNYAIPEVLKFGSNGQPQWQFAGYPYLDKVKVFSNGNTLGYTHFYNDYKLFLLAPGGTPIFSDKIINFLESDQGWFYFTTSDKIYAINPSGEIAWTAAHPTSYAVVSQDRDGALLLTETVSAINNNAADFLKLVGFDLTNTYSLSKYSKEGKLIWKIPVELPVPNPNRQVRLLGGTFPSKDTNGSYLVAQLLITLNQNEGVGNWDNFTHTTSITKITRPCYEKWEPTLTSSTQTVCENRPFQLSSKADSLGFLTYQWQRDGQTLASTRQPVFETTGVGTYRVTIRDSVCGTSFNSAEVKLLPRPALQASVTTTGSTDFCEGSEGTLLTANTPVAELKYQWLRNGQPVSTLFQPTLRTAEAGRYQLLVQDSLCGTNALSTDITVKVRPLPEAVITPEVNGAVYAPLKAKLRAGAGTGYTYQWLKESAEIAGATDYVYEAGENGNYTVRVTKEGCSRTSPAVTVTILQPLGTEPTMAVEMEVYPNPNRGSFELKLPRDWQKAEVELYDVLGRQLPLSRSLGQYRVEAVPGMYWLRLRLAEKEVSRRLVIIP